MVELVGWAAMPNTDDLSAKNQMRKCIPMLINDLCQKEYEMLGIAAQPTSLLIIFFRINIQ